MKTPSEPNPSYRVGPFFLDSYRREATKGGARQPLGKIEFSVFLQLAQEKGGVVLRKEFAPWSSDALAGDRHPVDSVIANLRKVVGAQVIETVRGSGYRIAANVPVTEVAGPSVNPAQRLKAIALDRMNVFTLDSLVSSIQDYEQVLRHGPDADAYANLAMNYINQGHTGFCLDMPQRTISKARDKIQEALHHYPEFSSAYALRALTYLIYEYDQRQADADLKRAFALNSNDEYAHVVAAHFEASQGHFEKSVEHARRAADLDWRSPMTVFTVPWMLVLSGHPDQGLLECERALSQYDPFAVGHIICGYAWEAVGEPSKAVAEYQASLEIAPFPDAVASMGHAAAISGDKRTARECLEKLRKFKGLGYMSAYLEGLIYIGLGEKDRALASLERAYSQKCDWLIYLNVEPRWQLLKGERRFRTLARRVGLA